MSRCSCDRPTDVRVSDEGIMRTRGGERAQLRCRTCGGKAGRIDPTFLQTLGFSESEIRASVEPGPGSQIWITAGVLTFPDDWPGFGDDHEDHEDPEPDTWREDDALDDRGERA